MLCLQTEPTFRANKKKVCVCVCAEGMLLMYVDFFFQWRLAKTKAQQNDKPRKHDFSKRDADAK